MEVECEEVRPGFNIPGRVVGGDYSCKEMLMVNDSSGWQFCTITYMPQSANNNNQAKLLMNSVLSVGDGLI